DRGLGGVEVLGPLVVFQQAPRAEADGVAGDVTDRPHQTAPETVVDAAPALRDQPAGGQLRLGEAAAPEHAGQRVPALGGEPHPEAGGGLLVEAAFGEEASAHLGGRGVELLAVVLLGDRVGVQQAAPRAEVRAVAAPLAGVLV